MEKQIDFDFKDIDYKGGKIRHDTYYLSLEEDMLSVDYENGFFIDVGWYEGVQAFKIYVICDCAWDAPEKVYTAYTSGELLLLLNQAILFTSQECKKHKANYL